jgi:hypothetical protein
MIVGVKPFYAMTVTVGTTPVSLLSLMQAIDSTIIGAAREISIQSDPTNSGSVLIGDSLVKVSPQRCMAIFLSGDSSLTRAGLQTQVPLSALYAVATAANQLLNVGVWD